MQHNVGTLGDLALYRLKVAEEDLETAQSNIMDGHFRGANNRAYYAIYHAITAVLALEETAFKSHKMTIAYFNKTYVKPEIFPRIIGRKINDAEIIRHASDYDEFYIASKEESLKQINTAKEFIDLVKQFVSGKREEIQ
ncbi:MAG: HEPN domain-containing protein [Lachnospiraceae bacterium]|nr:HEPN domain-containing protein [Lachnospiraceae bacterium]